MISKPTLALTNTKNKLPQGFFGKKVRTIDLRKYEKVSIDKLIPYENNAKIHNDAQIDKVAKSIEEFGFINPVLIDENYNIIAGHCRTLSAKRLGMDEVPCLFVEDLSD